MLVYANLSEYKINASPIHEKVAKSTEKTFHYLLLCSKYQHTSAQNVTYRVYSTCTQSNMPYASICLYAVVSP